ncbi:uncharacterized protein LOC130655093 [Hydractinia symbiolongicarpus]|uniref:uncharacterized protein LOC130655093 n=1 Tax=Hydractinia symbiolongicarpus TaxID=13093 RepID=UPI00254C21D9|nr:uncharacterized protein LOC130655093 [Hydractinia symbiolongicarpus]
MFRYKIGKFILLTGGCLFFVQYSILFYYRQRGDVFIRNNSCYQVSTPNIPKVRMLSGFSRLRKTMQEPCKQNMLWSQRKQNNSFLRTDFDSTQFILTSDASGSSVAINIITYANGEKKNYGGDFWWMEIRGTSSIYSDILDNMDGTYEAQFRLPEAGKYEIKLTLEFSQCDGLRDPPVWWFINGTEHGKYQTAILDKSSDYIDKSKKLYVENKSRKAVKLSSDKNKYDLSCKYINHPHGYWKTIGSEKKYTTYTELKHKKEASFPKKNNTFWVYGDSVGMQFYSYLLKNHTICSQFRHCRADKGWIYPFLPGISIKKYDQKDFNETITLNKIESILTDKLMVNSKSIFLINFGLHMMMDLSFMKASQLFLNFIKLLKTLRKKQEIAKIIWKTTTPVLSKKGMNSERFLTRQRIILWNAFTKEVICREGIPILDVYEMAASYPEGSTDGVHFADKVFESAAVALITHIQYAI